MLEFGDLGLPVLVATGIFVALIIVMGGLMVINSVTRYRHRSRMAELRIKHVEAVNEAEREATSLTLSHIGRELHDNVGQILSFTKMTLNLVETRSETEQPKLIEAMNGLDQGIDEVRRLGRSLNMGQWESRSLRTAIDAEAARMERIGLAKVLLHTKGPEKELKNDIKIILYRTFQEVANNALKHGGGDTLNITFDNTKEFTLSVADNGSGFDPDNISAGAGLHNIKKRCAMVGMKATLITAPDKGCEWIFKEEHEGAENSLG